ncbi:MAG: hypothetical protein KatS3mg044_0693 [Rhodothermaceae bacterium]|nr:MAG: hypothetical protein KatS3mg044_0693 [Rhodothermaceae bacterium]
MKAEDPIVFGGPTVVSCRAPYGAGGLGRHFARVVEIERAAGRLHRYFSIHPRPGDEGVGIRIGMPYVRPLIRMTPLRFLRGWKNYVVGDLFDRVVAARLEPSEGAFIGFVGKSLHSFRVARAGGTRCLALHVGNSHVRKILRRHAAAYRQWGLERSWLNAAQARKAIREYEMADLIFVNSAYTWASFVEEGVPESKLRRFRLEPDGRFVPPASRPDDDVFRVVYAGSLSVPKGIPVLVEAFTRLVGPARLTLVGTWSSRGMRRYLERARARDPRIHVQPGDPLPHYQQADVCVHPSYEDGFAYAPAEALACGTPVVVTEDTGMKELVREGENGYIVPTGDVDALYERLAALQRAKQGRIHV